MQVNSRQADHREGYRRDEAGSGDNGKHAMAVDRPHGPCHPPQLHMTRLPDLILIQAVMWGRGYIFSKPSPICTNNHTGGEESLTRRPERAAAGEMGMELEPSDVRPSRNTDA